MNPEYTLYCFAQSGNAFKAALMLNLCGAKWTPRHVDFFNGETRTPEYRKNVNEMGEAPVLEFAGRRLSQSGVILDYLSTTFKKFGWKDEKQRREILHWHPQEGAVIARVELLAGTTLGKENVRAAVRVAAGHKVAVRAVAKGRPVHRYNQIIGFATQAIEPGDHVHVHNVAMGDFQRDYAYCALKKDTQYVAQPATFMGIKRADGRVATRNYIGILTSVNCSATVARMIAEHFKNRLDDYPNVDGVGALTHKTGCGMASEGEATNVLRRTIAGYARHPNFYSSQLVGLGCEANQINMLLSAEGLKKSATLGAFTIQEKGGTRKAGENGIARGKEMLPEANQGG